MTDTSAGKPETLRNRAVVVLRNLLTEDGRSALDWDSWSEPGRTGVQIFSLYATGEPQNGSAFLAHFAPGAHGDLHEHLGYELMFILDGELVNDNDDRYGPGDLVIEAPGSVHRVSSDSGVTVLGVREAPTVPR